MFLSATKIEKNKAAGLGVAGRRMESAAESQDPVQQISETDVLQRARRRYAGREREKAAA